MATGEAHAAWHDPDWNYRKKITIQSNRVASDQADFPVLINTIDPVWRDASNGGKVGKSNGGDILFTSSDGTTKLSHVIETYDPSAGELVAWVNIPSVSSSSDTEIYIYYGNPGAADQWDTYGNTWNSNYGIVYQMESSCTDSTSNNRNCIAVIGGPSADNTYLGKGLSFDGNDAWSQSDMSYWEQQWNTRSHDIVFRTGGDVTARQVLFAEGAGANGVMLYILGGNIYARWWSESQGWNGDYISAGISTNTTYHVILSYEYPGGSYELFVNGSSAGSNSTPAAINSHGGNGGLAYTGPSGKDFHDMASSQGHYFTGSIYDFRVRDNASDSGYAATTYNNQSSPATFYSTGSEETASLKYWVGGSGSWSDDINHWAASSGGSAGAGNKPTTSDIVIFDTNSGGGACTFDENVSIDSFEMRAGNTTSVDAVTYDFITAGDLIIAEGVFYGNNSTIRVGKNWDSSAGTWSRGSSIVILTGTGSVAQNTSGSPWTRGFNDIIVAAAGQTTTLTSNQIWVQKLTVGSGTFTDGSNSYSVFLQGVGDVFVDGGGAITVQNFYYRSNNYTQNIVGRDYSGIGTLGLYGVGGSSGSNVYNMQGNITANSLRIWLNNNAGDARNSVLNTNNYSITTNYLYLGSNGDTNDYSVLNSGSSSISISRNVTIYPSDSNGTNEIDFDASNWTVSGDWTNNDTFTGGSGSVFFNGTGTQNITSGGDAFNNLTITNSSSGGVVFSDALTTDTLTDTTNGSTLKFATTGTHTINNTLTLTGGTGPDMISLEPATASTNWYISPPAGTTVNGVDAVNSRSDKTITATNSNDGGSNTNWNFGSTTRYWVAGTAGNWSVPANWSDTSGGSGGFSVPGTGDTAVFDTNGTGDCTFDAAPSISTLTSSGYGGTISTGTNNLTVAAMTFSGGTFLTGNQTTTVTGTLTVSGGTLSAGSGNIDAGGVTISSGTLTAPGSGNTFTVSGDWNNTGGTFSANGGTVTFDGSSQNITGNTVFYNLSKTATTADTLTFAAGTDQTISGTIILSGTPGNPLALASSSNGNKWGMTFPGAAQTVSFIDVRDSDANTNTVTCMNCTDSGNNNANWLFDPFGIVFDSATNTPIEGAEVRLWYDTGGGNWILARPGIEINAADQNPQTTGAAGAYKFLTIVGTFRFTVSADGYTYPSGKSSFPAGRVICPGDAACAGQPGSKGEQFVVSGSAIQMDLPLDGNVHLLKVTKEANKKEAATGDIVTYTVTIKNNTSSGVTGVYAEDMIPAGFKYVTDRAILDNKKTADPDGQRPVIFNIGSIAAGQTRTLKYQLVTGSGVSSGKYMNSIRARYADGTVISNTAREEIKILPDPLFDHGTVIGKVFWDRNENGVQDSAESGVRSAEPKRQNIKDRTQKRTKPGEAGIADVRIVTEEGTVITTDNEGRFHLAGVVPGRHIFMIDERTLPEGSYPVTDGAVLVDITPGIMQKVNFGITDRQTSEPGAQNPEQSQNDLLRPESARIRRPASGTQNIDYSKRTTDAGTHGPDNSEPAGEGALPSLYKSITSSFNDFIFVGLADVRTGHTDTSGNIKPVEDDGKFRNGFWSEGRIAYYLKGKIKGKYIITSSLDTDREKKELFRNIDPDKYYPVYGDASTVNHDAADTQGILYAAVEWDRSKALWGNYRTEINDTELARFNRALHGTKLHYETIAITQAGKPETEITIFQAEARQRAAHNEFPGTGGSLYYLRHRPLIEGSENVTLEIRDKNTGLTITKIDQVNGEDYEIDYSNARIMFYVPVSQAAESNTIISTALLNGHPVYVIVDYEYEVNESDFSERSYGGRIEQSINGITSKINVPYFSLLKDLRLGGTYIREAKDRADYELKGMDSAIHLGKYTEIKGEYAESNERGTEAFISTDGGLTFTEVPTLQTDRGSAYSLRAHTKLFDHISLEGYYRKIEKGFSDSSSLFHAGKQLLGGKIEIDLAEKTRLVLNHDLQRLLDNGTDVTSGQVGAQRTDTTTVQMTHEVDKLKLTGEYRHTGVKQKTDTSESETNREGNSAAIRADYRIRKDLGVFLGQQVTLSGEDNHQTTAGASVKLFRRMKVRISETIGTKGNATSAYTSYDADDKTEIYNSWSLENSQSGGNTTSHITGARKQLTHKMDLTAETRHSNSDTEDTGTNILGLNGQLNKRWGLSGSYEKGIVQSVSGSISDRNAGSIGIGYTEKDRIKASVRIELRTDDGQQDRRHYLAHHALLWKLNREITLSGKIHLSESRNTTLHSTDAQYKEFVLGGAYRPVRFDRLNLLGKYSYLEDIAAPGQSDMSDIEATKAHVLALDAVYDLTDKWQIVEKLAFKQANEKVSGFDFTGTQTWLWINRINYNVLRNWQVGAEYRMLRQQEANDMKQGVLIEVARYLNKYIQIGVGYNFTHFNDNLTYLDYTAGGPFFRLSARMSELKW